MVNWPDPQPRPEPPSVTDILNKFKAEQAGLSNTPEPAAKINGSPTPDGYEPINTSVFDKFARLATWDDILQPQGWKQVRPPDTATLEAWQRPGGTHPVSAKVLKANPNVLVVHSEDAGLPSGAGQKLTKPRLHAHLHYGGIESAFAKDLAAGNAIGVPTMIAAATAVEGAAKTTVGTFTPPEGSQNEPESLEAFAHKELFRMKARKRAQELLSEEEAGPVALPDFVPLDEFLAIPDTSTPYLVDGLWPKGGRVVFAAQNKAGKSTARDNIVKSLVDGDDFLSKYKVHMPAAGTVVVIDDELHEDQLRRWLRDHDIRNQPRVVVVPMRGKAASFDLTTPEIRAKWAAKMRAMRAVVVLLDCLRPILDALGLSEDKDAGKFLVQFDALLNEAGVEDAMVIHHMGHSGERSRGDSRILDWPDAVWSLVKENPDDPHSARYFKAYGRDVEVYESRLGYDPRTRQLTIVGGSRGDAAAEAAIPAVTEYLESHSDASKNAIEEAVKGDHTVRAIRGALKLMVGYGLVLTSGEGKKGKPIKHRLAHLDTSTDLDTTSTSNSQTNLDTSTPRLCDEVEVEVNEASNPSQSQSGPVEVQPTTTPQTTET